MLHMLLGRKEWMLSTTTIEPRNKVLQIRKTTINVEMKNLVSLIDDLIFKRQLRKDFERMQACWC